MSQSISFEPCFIASLPLRSRSYRLWRNGKRSARGFQHRVSRIGSKACASLDNASQIPIPLQHLPDVPVVPLPTAGATYPSGAPLRAWWRLATRALRTLWRFSRPHTIWGTLVAVSCMHLLAWLSGGWYGTAAAATNLAVALVPALFLNVFIVGLNQYYDVPIDAINKPYLPLAAGTLSLRSARRIILGTLIAGLAFCFAPGATAPLRVVLLGSVALGTVYSMPPMRLKRYPPARERMYSLCARHADQPRFLHARDADGEVRGAHPSCTIRNLFLCRFWRCYRPAEGCSGYPRRPRLRCAHAFRQIGTCRHFPQLRRPVMRNVLCGGWILLDKRQYPVCTRSGAGSCCYCRGAGQPGKGCRS